MARIPICPDVAELIGPAAENVDNRSLLLDKFVFHKDWGLDGLRANDAHRWTLLRISDGGREVLHAEANRRRQQATRGGDREEHNRIRLQQEADLASKLAATSIEAEDAQKLRARHSRRFLNLFRNAYSNRASIVIGRLEGRLAINLADALIQNAGICLDRLFGLPFIPGSAVKGVCRHVALEELKTANREQQGGLFDAFRHVFGTADNDFTDGQLGVFRDLLAGRPENQKGAVAFLPAYPVNEARIVVDLANVHYPDYYHSGRVEDLAKETPRLIPFPVVEVGAQFGFCLVLNGINTDASLLAQATRWLEMALTVRGLGAKTAAGYGWFSLHPEVLEEILAEERKEAEAALAKARLEAEAKLKTEAEERRRAALKPEERARELFKSMSPEAFAQSASALASLSAEEQKGFLLALLAVEKKDTWKAWKKSDKPANKARVEAILAAAKLQTIILP